MKNAATKQKTPAQIAAIFGINPSKVNGFTTMGDIIEMGRGVDVPMRNHDSRDFGFYPCECHHCQRAGHNKPGSKARPYMKTKRQ